MASKEAHTVNRYETIRDLRERNNDQDGLSFKPDELGDGIIVIIEDGCLDTGSIGVLESNGFELRCVETMYASTWAVFR